MSTIYMYYFLPMNAEKLSQVVRSVGGIPAAAELLGVHPNTVRMWVKGHNNISEDHAIKLYSQFQMLNANIELADLIPG